MSIQNVIHYSLLFEKRPKNFEDLISDIPSKFVILIMSSINHRLNVKGDYKETQLALLKRYSTHIPSDSQKVILKIEDKINEGYTLFGLAYTMEAIDREIMNFREIENNDLNSYIGFEGRILLAYIYLIDEILEKEVKNTSTAVEDASNKGGKFLVKLLWPHFLSQFEFSKKFDATDIIYENFKGLALASFLERHAKFGQIVKAYFKSIGCDSANDYIMKIMSYWVPFVRQYVDTDSFNPYPVINIITVDKATKTLIIDPQFINTHKDRYLNISGVKDFPLIKLIDNKYIIPNISYLVNHAYSGMVTAIYYQSEIKNLYENEKNKGKGFGVFKSDISKEFSENILFKQTLSKCFSNNNDTLLFFDDKEVFNPDCYYRKGNNVFIIEFKDNLLKSEVVNSWSYDAIESSLREKFVEAETLKNGKKKIRPKGISQILNNIKVLVGNGKEENSFWSIDKNAKIDNIKLESLIIHPIIVHTNNHFDLPLVNQFLDEIFQEKIGDIKDSFNDITPVTMINLQYFYDNIMQFKDSVLELDSELFNYHNELEAWRIKANETQEPNDWLKSNDPFIFVTSENQKNNIGYKSNDFSKEIMDAWSIKI